jgi:hypothetical protein
VGSERIEVDFLLEAAAELTQLVSFEVAHVDTMEMDLPDVLLTATTRMAQHSHLFKLRDPSELPLITDAVWELPSGKSIRRQYCGDEEELCRSKGGYSPAMHV